MNFPKACNEKWMNAVHHDGSEIFIQPQSYNVGDNVHFRIRLHKESPINKIFIRICPDGEQELHLLELEEIKHNITWWGITLTLNEPVFSYRFLFISGDNLYWYNQEGFCKQTPLDLYDFRLLTEFKPIEWVRGSTFYQIFPDTFYNGNKANDVKNNEFLGNDIYPSRSMPWGGHPSYWGNSGFMDFFNGDLDGIKQKIDYLVDLGITALYLTPIFTSPTQHRYSITDFYNVDPHLGGNSALISLSQNLHKKNIRLLLDLTLNHCSKQHPWFLKALYNNELKERSYFTIDADNNYRGWLGDPSLPEFNYSSINLRKIMLSKDDSVIRYWLKPPYNIDGWRLDASNRIGRTGLFQTAREVGKEIRKAVKSVSVEKYIIGENFFDPSAQLQGDELDAVQNETGGGIPVLMWVAPYKLPSGPYKTDTNIIVQLSTEDFLCQLNEFQKAVPWGIISQQFNQITNHDSPRLLTLLGGQVDLVKLAFGLLFAIPGSPCIFYGDEIGMSGENALESRTCMRWDEESWNYDLLDFIKSICHLRQEHPSLSNGSFQVLLVEKDVLVFSRECKDEIMIVIACRKSSAKLSIDVEMMGLSNGEVFIDSSQKTKYVIQNATIYIDRINKPGIRFLLHRS